MQFYMTQYSTEIASATYSSPAFGLLSLRTCLGSFQMILQHNCVQAAV